MSILVQVAIAAIIFIAGAAGGIKWHAGQDAIKAKAEQEARDTDTKQQRQFNDKAAGLHAAQVDKLAKQLGNARERIASLSSTDQCIDADTVRVLNAIGAEPVRAAASQPAPATGAFATPRDVGADIAACRSAYAKASSQLNQILDIEDKRHPP
jgi:hypothetical protein